MVWSLHCSVGWSGIHIVQSSGLEFALFSEVVWSSHCLVGWSGVHIVQWGGLEFTLFSWMVWSSHCSLWWSGVHWGYQEFTLFCGVVWSLRCCVKDRVEVWSEYKWWSVEDSWFGWMWGPYVIYRLEMRSWPWNLKEKKEYYKLH